MLDPSIIGRLLIWSPNLSTCKSPLFQFYESGSLGARLWSSLAKRSSSLVSVGESSFIHNCFKIDYTIPWSKQVQSIDLIDAMNSKWLNFTFNYCFILLGPSNNFPNKSNSDFGFHLILTTNHLMLPTNQCKNVLIFFQQYDCQYFDSRLPYSVSVS